uniref:ATP-dependent RNA helicase n=1 Tax=Panagrolaimus davidi TaxID=227884 RepID=A0A914QHK3_9BILA
MAQSEGFSRGGFSSDRGGFYQPTSNDNQSNSRFACRGEFGPTHGSFGQSADNNQEGSGFGSSRGGGRGGSNSGRDGGFEIQKWEEVEFEPQVLTNIKERSKYSRPRKILGAAIPFILDGFDIKSLAETGSGKTAAFVLPIIDACMKAKMTEGEGKYESELASPFAIIIAPTRELVMQVLNKLKNINISVAKAYGQYNIARNHAEIRCGCDILVATPGRLKQFVTNGEILCNKLKFLVLDEADRLLDQNFNVDIMEIVNTPRFPAVNNRQTLLFSATFPDEMATLADQLLKKGAVFAPPRKAFECLICYTKYYEDEGALACSPTPEALQDAKEDDAEKHLICVTCIRGYAHNSIFDGPVAYGGIGLRCVTDKCENVLLLSDFEHYLSEEDCNPLKTRLQDQCLLDAGLADLVTCPECAYKVIVEQSLTFYTCICGRVQCRNCLRLYEAQHRNRTCQQMEELERQQASLRQIEPQMSEIVIRKCRNCNVAFVKSDGCNKMTCTKCGATSCYVCREANINYNHFCNCNTNRRTHGPCGTCGKSCRNDVDVGELDQQAMKRLRNRVNGTNDEEEE